MWGANIRPATISIMRVQKLAKKTIMLVANMESRFTISAYHLSKNVRSQENESQIITMGKLDSEPSSGVA